MLRKKTQTELLEEMNNRQKEMQREENSRAERAEERARYNALSSHEKTYYYDNNQYRNELAFQILVENYQKDGYSLKKSIEFAYRDTMEEYSNFPPRTPREKKIAAAKKKIAVDYRNTHFLSLENINFKKRVENLLGKKELTEKEVHAEILKEFLGSEKEFKQKFSEKFSQAIKLAASADREQLNIFLINELNYGISERLKFQKIYKPFGLFKILKKLILIVIAIPVIIVLFIFFMGVIENYNKDGQGTLTYANGDIYVGEQEDDKRAGQGTITYADGRKYVGEYQDGNWHGQGTLTDADGNIERIFNF